MVMEPAEVMGLASVMLDFSATTVQVNSQSHLKLRLFRTMGARGAWHLAPAECQASHLATMDLDSDLK